MLSWQTNLRFHVACSSNVLRFSLTSRYISLRVEFNTEPILEPASPRVELSSYIYVSMKIARTIMPNK